MDKSAVKKTIADGRAVLGIELGSTRIKAVLIGENHEKTDRLRLRDHAF